MEKLETGSGVDIWNKVARSMGVAALAFNMNMVLPNGADAGNDCGKDYSCGYNGYDKKYRFKKGDSVIKDVIKVTVCRVDWGHVAKNSQGKRGWVPTEYYPWNGKSFDLPMSYEPCITRYVKPGTIIVSGFSCAKAVIGTVRINKPGTYLLGIHYPKLTKKFSPELSQYWGYGFKTDARHVREIEVKARLGKIN